MRMKGFALCLLTAATLTLSPMAIPYGQAEARDCVRTVRALSDFTIRGDAWTWWASASGRHDRNLSPAKGAVLVFKRTQRLDRGHVSLISKVVDRRTIEVDHTWMEGRGLRRGMRILDVSARNDWSAVRVWHEASGQYGLRTYPTYGFIQPGAAGRSEGRFEQAVERKSEPQFTVAPSGRGAARNRTDIRTASAVLPARKPDLSATQVAVAVPQPERKPSFFTTSVAELPPGR